MKNPLQLTRLNLNDTDDAPFSTLINTQSRLVFRYLTVNFHDAESISDLLSTILKVPYSQLDVWQRLKVRRALALQVYRFEIIFGSRVAVSYGKKIELSNVYKARRSDRLYQIDYRTERSLIASLVDLGLLTLLERSDSRLLRGTPNMSNLKFSSCHHCAFSQWDGNRLFCSVINQDPAPRSAPLPTECQFYCFLDDVDTSSTSENYVQIFALDICHLNGILDEAVWEKDLELIDDPNETPPPPSVSLGIKMDDKAV